MNKKMLISIITAVGIFTGLFMFSACNPAEPDDTIPLIEDAIIENSPEEPADEEPPAVEEPAPPPAPVPITFDMTAEDLVRQIGVGWNLGNTLDAYNSGNPSAPLWVNEDDLVAVETMWLGGAANVTTPELIGRVKEAGFNAIRVPVTWYKMAGGAPDYIIRSDWMDRVQ